MVNFGPLAAEIVSLVWGTPANLKGFCALLRHCCDVAHWRPTTLCTMFGHILRCYTIYIYIYFWGLLPPDRILPVAKFTLRPSLAFSYIGTVTAWHSSSGRQPNFAALNRGRHLHSAGRPSGWALAHISSLCLFCVEVHLF